jgi:1,4-alpha-glucan branching enzyme
MDTTTEINWMETEPSLRTSDSLFAPRRFSAKRMTKPITFFYHSAKAKTIFLTGDFNGWNSMSHPMRRQPDGGWTIQIPLHHGHHRYRFLVDGQPSLDPCAVGTTFGPYGEKVSLIAVS